jgi:hydrogenase-4 component F
MAYLLILVPLAAAVLALAIPSERWRPWLLPVASAAHLALVGWSLAAPPPDFAPGTQWLALDPLGKVFLGFVSALFFLCTLYAPGYLAVRPERPNRILCANLLVSLAMMTLVILSQHLGLMWVAMEAITLVSAPAIYFNHNRRSLEATWKYLLVSSVGIALALLGSLFLAYSALKAGFVSSLLFADLVREAPQLSPEWLHSAFVLLLVGYGTKMGLAPMHTWKPDAYGEAPGLVGTLLAGGVTSCAFLAITRVYRICRGTGEAAFAAEALVAMGLLSMALAAVFVVRQRDFKRMLAYSSVEHMGILVIGLGVGGVAVYGALLHMINNGLTKGALFLSAGNIHRAYGSKSTEHVGGALRRVPFSAGLFLAGFLAITGSPPFGPFVSEFTIIRGTLQAGQFAVAAAFLLLLAIVFIGMGVTVLAVVQGEPPAGAPATAYRDRFSTVAPVVLFMALVLVLGLFIPAPLDALLRDAAATLEGTP